jgi:acetoin utilization deacetylase AcuC-like enzyme
VVLVVNGIYDDAGHEEEGHPERPERARVVRSAIEELHLESDLVVVPARAATRAELLRVHDGSYLDELGAFCYGGGGDIDQDTYATYDSWSIAQSAAGSGLAVIQELRRLDEGVGFVVTRPPGHHALRDRAMGFCLLNNIAVTAAALVDQGERVLILDWDVHHGNGTQQIFWNDPQVLYVSTHQSPLFPGTGFAGEVGGWKAIGRTVNIPLPRGTRGDTLQRALEEVASPVIHDFAPTWVLVSAGFDAHRADPLAELELTSGDFVRLAELATSFVSRPGRTAMFLEGGYDLEALRSSIRASLAAILGMSYHAEPRSSGDSGVEHIAQILSERRAAIEALHLLEANEDVR